jgi:hypothetical protein
MKRYNWHAQESSLPPPDASAPATPEQIEAIRRLSKGIRWALRFDAWLQKFFGFGQVEQIQTYGQAEQIIEALTRIGFKQKKQSREDRVAPKPTSQYNRRRIEALKSGRKNLKDRSEIPDQVPDPGSPATTEQLAAIGRLSRVIKWHNGFDIWLRTKFGLERVEQYGQAEKIVIELKNLLEDQMRRPRGAAPPDECAYPR